MATIMKQDSISEGEKYPEKDRTDVTNDHKSSFHGMQQNPHQIGSIQRSESKLNVLSSS
jgi:hypothetical protein